MDRKEGRYHSKSLTVMDYIMTELKVPDIGHGQTSQGLMSGQQAHVRMQLHNGPSTAEMSMKPSHLNPAFDLNSRAKKIPLHKGRKYYYDTQDYCEPSDEPMISSRGAALYIV